MKYTSLAIAFFNLSTISLTIIERHLKLTTKFEWLKLIVTPITFLSLFAFVFAIGGIFIGLQELRQGQRKSFCHIGIGINALLVIWFISFLIKYRSLLTG